MNCTKHIASRRPLVLGSKNPAIIAGVGAFAVLMYPAIGTVVAWCLGLSDSTERRIFQAATLVGGIVMLTAYAFGNIQRSVWWSFAKRFAIACTAFAILVVSAGNIFHKGMCFDVETVVSLGITATLFAVSAILITCVRSIGAQGRLQFHNNLNYSSTSVESVIRTGLQMTGLVLAVMVWYRGPEHADGSVHIAMFANPSLLGMGFLVVFLSLTFFQSAFASLISVPWLYLALFTTSRLVLVVLLCGTILQLITFIIVRQQAPRIRFSILTNIPATIMLLFILLAAPYVNDSLCFPYRSSGGKEEVRTELTLRFARLWRVMGFNAAVDSAAQKSAASEGLLASAAYSAAIVDDRYMLWRIARNLIIAEPFGQWPRVIEYRTFAVFPNGHKVPYTHSYPHNIILEAATLFGVLPSVIIALGFMSALIHLLIVVGKQYALTAVVMLLALTAEVLRMQFSGSIIDAVGAMIALSFISLLLYNEGVPRARFRASAPGDLDAEEKLPTSYS